MAHSDTVKTHTVVFFTNGNWKQGYHVGPLMQLLNKNGISWCQTPPGKKRSIMVHPDDAAEANRLKDEYFAKSKAKVAAYKAKCKLVWQDKRVNVTILNKVLRKYWGDNVFYLPRDWEGGSSIQNYAQSTFYTFNFIHFENCTKYKDRVQYMHIKNHATEQCWIMDVMQVLKMPAVEFELGQRTPGQKMEGSEQGWLDYLNANCKQTYTTDEFRQWEKDGKITTKTILK